MSQLARRDFLNGVALTVGGALLSPRDAFGLGLDDPARGRASYPPSLTGLRGSHAGSFEVAHALRDGSFWATAGAPSDTGESYDLVVVGAGISGLAAAWYFPRAPWSPRWAWRSHAGHACSSAVSTAGSA